MAKLIKSPFFDNWFVGKKPVEKLVICSPYIKEDALSAVLEEFGINGSSNVEVRVFTTGRPDVYVKGSSDITAIRVLAGLRKSIVHLVDNIHMKAYCIDNAALLVGSGNCTGPGLFSPGNVEAATSTEDSAVIRQFNEYCQAMVHVSKILSTSSQMMDFCSRYEDYRSLVYEQLVVESSIASKIQRLGMASFASHVYNVEGSFNVKGEVGSHPWVSSSSLSDWRQVAIVDAELNLSDISPATAYFLGGIVAGGAESRECEGISYRDCTVKQNNAKHDEQFLNRLARHASFVSEIAQTLGFEVKFQTAERLGLKNIFGGHVGFSFLFKDNHDDEETWVRMVLDAVSAADDNAVRAFLVGVYDTRGSVDSTFGLVTVDIPEKSTAQSLIRMATKCGVKDVNYNPPREREENKGKPRRPQLRIRIDEYFYNIGMISINKSELALRNEKLSGKQFIHDPLLPGLKML